MPSTFANSAIGSGQLANYVYGVSPLPPAPPFAPTEFLRGGNAQGQWYTPDFAGPVDAQDPSSASRICSVRRRCCRWTTCTCSTQNGWRTMHDQSAARHRQQSGDRRACGRWPADLQRVYGDRRCFGPCNSLRRATAGRCTTGSTCTSSGVLADAASIQVNYTLAWARGMGGSTDFTTQGGQSAADAVDRWRRHRRAMGMGPDAVDERHRVTVAGVFRCRGASTWRRRSRRRPRGPTRSSAPPNPTGDGKPL